MAPVLSVRDLTTSFLVGGAWRAVVRKLSFDVALGETLAIVGESGSGKSVASLSIMRLLPERVSRVEGSVQLEGRELTDDRCGSDAAGARRRNRDDLPGADDEPQPDLPDRRPDRRGDLAAIASVARTEARAETLRLLDRVRMPNAERRFRDYPHQFSGGMRQRVMIAMALAGKPKLLIADEPTTALDVTIQGQILDLLKTVQDEEGMSVLFITHDMGVVAEIADRMLVMYRGEQVETGAPADIFDRPTRPYTRMLIHAVPRLGSMQRR